MPFQLRQIRPKYLISQREGLAENEAKDNQHLNDTEQNETARGSRPQVQKRISPGYDSTFFSQQRFQSILLQLAGSTRQSMLHIVIYI